MEKEKVHACAVAILNAFARKWETKEERKLVIRQKLTKSLLSAACLHASRDCETRNAAIWELVEQGFLLAVQVDYSYFTRFQFTEKFLSYEAPKIDRSNNQRPKEDFIVKRERAIRKIQDFFITKRGESLTRGGYSLVNCGKEVFAAALDHLVEEGLLVTKCTHWGNVKNEKNAAHLVERFFPSRLFADSKAIVPICGGEDANVQRLTPYAYISRRLRKIAAETFKTRIIYLSSLVDGNHVKDKEAARKAVARIIREATVPGVNWVKKDSSLSVIPQPQRKEAIVQEEDYQEENYNIFS